MKSRTIALLCITVVIASPSHAATLLLSDNFNDNPNGASWDFNNNLGSTQAGTLATTAYSVQGWNWVSQHSNGGRLLVATSSSGEGNGSVSLNNNFATQANAANEALQISFNLHEVGGYGDTSRWVQFNVGNSQHLAVADGGVGVGILFRVSGEAGALTGGGGIGTPVSWVADDLITITLTGSSGFGSAFNGNGSKATITIGSTNYGTFNLAQQNNAYLTFSAFNYGNDQFGLGTFDNLSVSLVPEPGAALLGCLGTLALLRRRRLR